MKRIFPVICLAAAISLLLNAIWLSPAGAVSMPQFTSLGQIRTLGLSVPGAIDLDSAGNLFVADAKGGEVFKFDRYGSLKSTLRVGASGRGLAVTPDGTRLYVARDKSVVIVDPATGVVVGALAGAVAAGDEFGLVGELDLDAEGRVFAADAGTGRMLINIYQPTGGFIKSFGGIGVDAGTFNQIASLTINGAGQVVVADSSFKNGKIHVFTVDPSTLATTVVAYSKTSVANFGTPELSVPCGVAFDRQGRGYFLEYTSAAPLRVVDSAFAHLGKFDNSKGQLALVADAIVDDASAANARLFVSCDGGRIEVFGIDGGTSPVFVNSAPTTPVPQSPVGGSVVTSAAPVLSYQAATDADNEVLTYRVIVKQAGVVVYETSTVAVTVTVPAGLLIENAAYSWTVQATDPAGAASGTGSATFVVNAVNEAPSAPILLAPVQGESISGEGLLLWSAAADPDPSDFVAAYRVAVATDAAFGQVVATAEVAGTELTLTQFAAYPGLVEGANYFWRVTAIDNGQLASAPSAAGRFFYGTALLTVTANIPDARIHFSGNHGYAGRYVGTAPLVIRDLPLGPLSVVVERAGFEPYVAQVEVAAQSNLAVYAQLVPARKPTALKLVSNGINGRSGLAVNGSGAPFLVDFDNDGFLDLLTGDAAGNLMLFPALQVTSRDLLYFQPGRGLNLPVMPGAVPFVADWDNDGRKDLLIGRADGVVTLFLNIGLENAPAFGVGQDLTAGGSSLNVGSKAAPAVLDLNGDGRKDLVVGNATGQVVAFLNQGSDAAPQLAAAAFLFQVQGAVVPSPVDWNADGQRDLLITAGGKVTPYRNDLAVGGAFVAEAPVATGSFQAVAAMDINGLRGKDLLVGQADGRFTYWSSAGTLYVPAFLTALNAKVDEVAALVAGEAPALLAQVDKIRQQLAAGSISAAGKTASALATQLPVGAARSSAQELALLCK